MKLLKLLLLIFSGFIFFKVSPNTLDDIFAVKADSTWETDQFLVNSYVGCKVVRPLSRDGVPY